MKTMLVLCCALAMSGCTATQEASAKADGEVYLSQIEACGSGEIQVAEAQVSGYGAAVIAGQQPTTAQLEATGVSDAEQLGVCAVTQAYADAVKALSPQADGGASLVSLDLAKAKAHVRAYLKLHLPKTKAAKAAAPAPQASVESINQRGGVTAYAVNTVSQ